MTPAPATTCPKCGRAFDVGEPPLFCPNCGRQLKTAAAAVRDHTRSGFGRWWQGLTTPVQAILIVVVALAVLAGLGAVFGSDDSGSTGPDYQRALEACKNTAGVQWMASHPGGSASDPDEVRSFAAAINRCLVDTYNVDPKYLPDKPLAP